MVPIQWHLYVGMSSSVGTKQRPLFRYSTLHLELLSVAPPVAPYMSRHTIFTLSACPTFTKPPFLLRGSSSYVSSIYTALTRCSHVPASPPPERASILAVCTTKYITPLGRAQPALSFSTSGMSHCRIKQSTVMPYDPVLPENIDEILPKMTQVSTACSP